MKKLLNTFLYLTFGLLIAALVMIALYAVEIVEITPFGFYVTLGLFAGYAVCFFCWILLKAFHETRN